jgi:heat shock protein HslJ
MRFFFLLALLAGCAPSPKPPAPSGPPASQAEPTLPSASGLTGTQWRLLQIGAEGVPATATLAFSDSTMSGRGGCNQFSGPYTAEGGGGVGQLFSAGPLASTRMFCGEQQAFENRYFEALDGAQRWSIEGDTLELSGAGTALTFLRDE